MSDRSHLETRGDAAMILSEEMPIGPVGNPVALPEVEDCSAGVADDPIEASSFGYFSGDGLFSNRSVLSSLGEGNADAAEDPAPEWFMPLVGSGDDDDDETDTEDTD